MAGEGREEPTDVGTPVAATMAPSSLAVDDAMEVADGVSIARPLRKALAAMPHGEVRAAAERTARESWALPLCWYG